MSARTIETTDWIEEALRFLANEAKTNPDDYLAKKLNALFNDIVNESNTKKYAAASKILESKDPAKIIPALKDLLNQ